MENSQNKQYLTFKLSDEQYGLDVLQVREVLEIPRITRVPRMPDFMRGVVNIRGSVVPVIDLRLKLGLGEGERTADSRVVIIEIQNTKEISELGILVDSVQEVMEIQSSDISAPPQFGTKIDVSFITGIARNDSGFTILIKIDQIFETNEIQVLSSTAVSEMAVTTEA